MGSIKKNFIYNSIYQLLIIILPLITTPYISRVLGAENIGTYSYTYSIAYYFVMIAMLGVNNYGNRSCATVRDNRTELSKTFCSIYALQLMIALFCIIAYVIYAFTISRNNQVIVLIQIFYVISAAFDINWLFFGLEKFKVTIARNLFVKLFTVILVLTLIKNNNQLWLYTTIMAVGTLLSQLVIWPFLRRNVDLYIPSFHEILAHFKPNIVLFVPVIAVSLYKYMDKILIGLLSNMTQEGYYAQVEKILNIPLGLISALGTVMLPRMSNLVNRNKMQESLELINSSMIFISFLSIGMAMGLAGISPVFIPMFLGEAFLDCSNLLAGLSISVIFVAWANVIRTQFLIPNKMDKSYLITVCTGAVINMVVNSMLIGRLGAMGAVIGNIFVEASVALLQTYFVRRLLPIKLYFRNSIHFLFGGILMFLLIRSLMFAPLTNLSILFLQICIGGAFYTVYSYFILYFFHKKLLQELKHSMTIKLRNRRLCR